MSAEWVFVLLHDTYGMDLWYGKNNLLKKNFLSKVLNTHRKRFVKIVKNVKISLWRNKIKSKWSNETKSLGNKLCVELMYIHTNMNTVRLIIMFVYISSS